MVFRSQGLKLVVILALVVSLGTRAGGHEIPTQFSSVEISMRRPFGPLIGGCAGVLLLCALGLTVGVRQGPERPGQPVWREVAHQSAPVLAGGLVILAFPFFRELLAAPLSRTAQERLNILILQLPPEVQAPFVKDGVLDVFDLMCAIDSWTEHFSPNKAGVLLDYLRANPQIAIDWYFALHDLRRGMDLSFFSQNARVSTVLYHEVRPPYFFSAYRRIVECAESKVYYQSLQGRMPERP
jgi:hypothetical protein